MGPFHVVRLAGDALDKCRQRVQQHTIANRGRSGDPLYAARRTLHTRQDLLTDQQKDRLEALVVADDHAQVEATWGIYQRVIAAYRVARGLPGETAPASTYRRDPCRRSRSADRGHYA